MVILLVILGYLAVLMLLSRLTARRSTNDAFFRGERRSPWYMVAWGMIGASISGVTFVSVPGMVLKQDMTYLQMCLGFIPGYFIVALVLLPIYYKLNLTSIYTFLGQRLGREAYKMGASFFLLSKMTGAAARFYLVCMVIWGVLAQTLVPTPNLPSVANEGFAPLCGAAATPVAALKAPVARGEGGLIGLGDSVVNSLGIQTPLPSGGVGGGYQESFGFLLVVLAMIALIWLYTRRGGIKTLVWTDSLQTLCMFGALLLIIYKVMGELGLDLAGTVSAIAHDSHSRVFVWDDWVSRQNFWKQFLSGIFVVIVMTGLDQDMMQKNLTCRSLRDAQKDMAVYGLAFFPANLLFLSLGVLLVLLAQQRGVDLPAAGDQLLPMFAATGSLGQGALVLFVLGIVAAAFSSADSALTAMTTSYCVDLCGRPDDERLRRRVHIGMALVFIGVIMLFRLANSPSVIDAIYVMCGYTYGPLLGLFAYSLSPFPSPVGRGEKNALANGVTSEASPMGGGWVGAICIAAPLLCFAIDQLSQHLWGYRFGYELLMLNGLLSFSGLWAVDHLRK